MVGADTWSPFKQKRIEKAGTFNATLDGIKIDCGFKPMRLFCRVNYTNSNDSSVFYILFDKNKVVHSWQTSWQKDETSTYLNKYIYQEENGFFWKAYTSGTAGLVEYFAIGWTYDVNILR